MKNFFKSTTRLAAVILILAMLAAMSLAGCGEKTPTSGDTIKFGVWMLNGEDSAYYAKYEQNPGIEYLLSKTWGPDNKKVELEFFIPVAGAQQENFNTLLSTGDYPDMMNTTMYTGSYVDLYEQGIILDLTELIDQYMPNYKAFLAANPDVAKYATHLVDGERKFLTLQNYRDGVGYNWGGYIYRRDWIIKYGKNPKDGSAFSGSYTGTLPDGSVDKSSWEDNVVFPSGGADPVYISDWEWMFEIFQRALDDQGVTDGYVTSLSYPGYIGTGDLTCSFGGGSAAWYTNKSDEIVFGGNSDDFRVYLQAMNTWWENGWIDKAFSERSNDMFFRIDDTSVRSGKVGLWYGVQNMLIGSLDDGEGLKAGLVAYGARQPINDIYGSAAQQNVEPYTMYQQGREGGSWIITDKAKDKDLATFLTMLDYMYSEEGSIIGTMGLNKAQYEATQNELYTRLGLTDGSYTRVPAEQERGTKIYAFVDTVQFEGGSLMSACKPNRFFFMDAVSKYLERGSESYLSSLDQWVWYENTGFMQGSFTSQVSPDNQKTVAKTMTNITEFMAKSVPPFIKGEKDPFSDADWESYVKAINKYNPAKVTTIYQELLDQLKG